MLYAYLLMCVFLCLSFVYVLYLFLEENETLKNIFTLGSTGKSLGQFLVYFHNYAHSLRTISQKDSSFNLA